MTIFIIFMTCICYMGYDHAAVVKHIVQAE